MSEQERDELEQDQQEDLELDEKTAEGVKGGDKTQPTTVTQDITVNKAKTADKAFNSWNNYIRG